MQLGLLAAMLSALAGCGPDYSPNTYAAAAVQQANKVDSGVIVGVRQIAISADGTIGAAAGGAAGGVIGSQAPGGITSALGVVGGTLVGGLIGTTVAHTAGDTKAFEYIVRQPKGDLISVTQKDKAPLRIGQKVLVITGKQARVVPDYTVPADASAAAKPADAGRNAELALVPPPPEAPAPAPSLVPSPDAPLAPPATPGSAAGVAMPPAQPIMPPPMPPAATAQP